VKGFAHQQELNRKHRVADLFAAFADPLAVQDRYLSTLARSTRVPLINSDNLSDSVEENGNGDGNAKHNRAYLAEAEI
jgi:hypothetical protein